MKSSMDTSSFHPFHARPPLFRSAPYDLVQSLNFRYNNDGVDTCKICLYEAGRMKNKVEIIDYVSSVDVQMKTVFISDHTIRGNVELRTNRPVVCSIVNPLPFRYWNWSLERYFRYQFNSHVTTCHNQIMRSYVIALSSPPLDQQVCQILECHTRNSIKVRKNALIRYEKLIGVKKLLSFIDSFSPTCNRSATTDAPWAHAYSCWHFRWYYSLLSKSADSLLLSKSIG